MAMTVKNPKFLAVVECETIFQFDVTLTSTLTTTISVDILGKDWGVSDDKQVIHLVRYKTEAQSTNCSDYQPIENLQISALEPNQLITLALRATGFLDRNVKSYFVTVAKAGRIESARWQIDKPGQ